MAAAVAAAPLDAAAATPRHAAADSEAARTRVLFDACDADGDGLVSRADLEATLRRLAGRSEGSRAKFASFDKDGDGALAYDEFTAAVFQRGLVAQAWPGASSGVIAEDLPGDPSSEERCAEYFASQRLAEVLVDMARGVSRARPEDPHAWMMEYLARHRPRRGAAAAPAPGRGKSGQRSIRVNTSAVLRKAPKKLLDAILGEPGWEAVESAADTGCAIYFTWDSRAFLQRLGHPSCAPAPGAPPVPPLPEAACVNRLPGMGHLCDKVNMALGLRLLQKLWPEKFSFWPKSWLLPAEMDQLRRWLGKHKGDTVIVKPADGSLGEGIFLAQSPGDLDAKLLAKPHWGGGFSALAQRYLPNPLLIGGLKFDLRLYVALTSTDPLTGYLCREGLARFCTTKYEKPSAANANEHYMHLTNFSVNKKSAGFVKADDPFDVDSQASKRPLSTLLRQIEVQEAAQGRIFDEARFYTACEEVVAVLLQSLAPVLNVTYARVAKEAKPKPKAKAKAKKAQRKGKKEDSSDEEEEDDSEGDEGDEYEPRCFQVLGVDVLLDENLQPWLLEVNGRPSMDIEEPVRLSEAPEGMRSCKCRDMDGEEHVHLPSKVDMLVKSTAMRGAFDIVVGRPLPPDYIPVKFEEHGPAGDLSGTLNLIARLYKAAGGADKAFTTYGVRRALAGAIEAGLNPHQVDAAVTRWKHQGYRQSGDLEKDTAEIGVLDFAGLLQEVAMLQPDVDEDEPLDALIALIDACDVDD
mmetsp:Transcript_69800/g.214038  ORF Transcript_69800/g.214038 Transcript_69800/m.214038 type:complete len:748 (-) Transcript_69800:76-2319(-)